MEYDNVKIENFRSIEALLIQDFRKINVLVGKNNCGKTSVLEALFLLSGMSNPELTVNIHSFRDFILTSDEDFSFLFRNLDLSLPITISAHLNGLKRKLLIAPRYDTYSIGKEIKPDPSSLHGLSTITRRMAGLSLTFTDDSDTQFNAMISLKEKKSITEPEYTERLHCAYINQKTALVQLDKRVESLLITKRLDTIISILKNIDPSVSDIRMGANGRIWIDVGAKNMLPLNIMGDGMIRILNLISIISDTRDGVVLVDEIENGLHYHSLSVLWNAVFTACYEYNVQLVATTHSFECIEALSEAYEQFTSHDDDIRLFRIDRRDSKHTAATFNAELLKAGIEKEFEVR